MKREQITERPIILTVVCAMHAYPLGEHAMIFCGYMLNQKDKSKVSQYKKCILFLKTIFKRSSFGAQTIQRRWFCYMKDFPSLHFPLPNLRYIFLPITVVIREAFLI